MTESFSNIQWQIIQTELQSESDRSAGIVATSLVENELAKGIKSRLLPMSKEHGNRLFGDRGPLGTLNSKIDLGFSLGLFGKTAKSDLHNIRRIRNKFAHSFNVDFANEEVVVLIEGMTQYNPNDLADFAVMNNIPDPFSIRIVKRWKFMFAVISIVSGIQREASGDVVVKLPVYLA